MAKLATLFSSSKGNCTYVSCSGGALFIDAGVSLRQLEAAMCFSSLEMTKIKGVLVTHEHTDHIKGLYMLLKKYKLKVYGSSGTIRALEEKQALPPDCIPIVIGCKEYEIGGMQVKPFSTSHDSAESTGYIITTTDDKKISIATDLGCVTDDVFSELCKSDLVMLESNYDEKMLLYGSYPEYLKIRIASKVGHLSNYECGKTVASLLKNGTARFVLAHLSEENNTPLAAYKNTLCELVSEGAVIGKDFLLDVAPKNCDGKVMIF